MSESKNSKGNNIKEKKFKIQSKWIKNKMSKILIVNFKKNEKKQINGVCK